MRPEYTIGVSSVEAPYEDGIMRTNTEDIGLNKESPESR